jgi:uncharacterized protein YjbI with pentapeptide repeats
LSARDRAIEPPRLADDVQLVSTITPDEDGRVDLEFCRVRGARVSGQTFDRPHFTDVVFDECDFAGVTFDEAVLVRVHFRMCRLSGLQLAGARVKDLLVTDSKGDGINLRMSKIERSGFVDCELPELDAGAAVLTNVDFVRCNLTAASLHRAKVSRVALHGSRIDGLLGVETVRGLVIGTDQLLPMAAAAFTALGIAVDDDYAGPTSPQQPSRPQQA